MPNSLGMTKESVLNEMTGFLEAVAKDIRLPEFGHNLWA